MVDKRRIPEKTTLEEIKALRHDGSDTKFDKDGQVVSISKTATTMTVVNAEEAKGADAAGFLSPELFQPNQEQLEKINQFTLRTVGAGEVACFTTHSCNDLIDRDDDRFNTKAVKGFAELPHPYSPTGKSFMIGHDYTKLAIGRIFDTDTAKFKHPDGTATKLTNDVYIPKISANETFIANQEMGVNWAVSVGVMLGESKCFIGKAHEWGWAPWFCSKGHEKGLCYDPDSDKEDEWGWPEPVSESSAKAVKCFRDLNKAKDMYELSQVFLGAQYYAQIGKDPTFEGVIKTASVSHVPIMGLSREEAKGLKVPHLPEKMRAAARNHTLEEEEGRFTMVDDQKMVWSFTPGQDTEPLLLGKSNEGALKYAELRTKLSEYTEKFETAETEFGKPDFTAKDADAVAVVVPKLRGLLSELDAAITSQDLGAASDIMDNVEDAMEELYDALYDDQSDDDQGGQDADADPVAADRAPAPPIQKTGDQVTKKAVAAALSRVSLPKSAIDVLDKATDENALDEVMKAVASEFDKQSVMASAGAQYIKDLEADVLEWHRKAYQDPKMSGLDVSSVEKLLKAIDGNPEVLKAMRDEKKAIAESRFGTAVRRSTVEPDVNDPSGEKTADKLKEHKDRQTPADRKVSRIHGE